MLNNTKLSLLLIILIVISPLLAYTTNSGIIAYLLLPFCLLLIIFSIIVNPIKMQLKSWGLILALLPYTIWAFLYYILNPYENRYLTGQFITIVILPFVVYAALQIFYYSENIQANSFVYNIILYTLTVEIIISIGQMLTYSYGVGLPVVEEYKQGYAITGSFYNPNDLGITALLCSVLFMKIEHNRTTVQRIIIWTLIISLLFISGSRSALVATFLIFLLGSVEHLK